MDNELRAFTKGESMDWLVKLAKTSPQLPLALTPIPYHHAGTNYANDTIRMTSSSLERLGEWIAPYAAALLAYETAVTRLGIVVQASKDKDSGEPTGSWALYITLHKRSPRVIMNRSANMAYQRTLGEQ